ncbi:MAG TPA: copper-binding protein [Terriglobia bacterium]|nr:copper-binding protein [Terriglobia bacterium]
MKRYARMTVLSGCAVFALALSSCGPEASKTEETKPAETTEHAGAPENAAKKEYAFTGTVEKVDPEAGTVDVKNEDIPGWMSSMTMTYKIDQPDVLKSLKPGDHIKAKVYEGDFKMLYGVEPESAK